MIHNVHGLIVLTKIVLAFAAAGTTAVPVIYAFSPWRSRLLGRIFMLKATSYAMTMDLTLLFAVWHPVNILIQLWIQIVVLTVVVFATFTQAILIWKYRRDRTKKEF